METTHPIKTVVDAIGRSDPANATVEIDINLLRELAEETNANIKAIKGVLEDGLGSTLTKKASVHLAIDGMVSSLEQGHFLMRVDLDHNMSNASTMTVSIVDLAVFSGIFSGVITIMKSLMDMVRFTASESPATAELQGRMEIYEITNFPGVNHE